MVALLALPFGLSPDPLAHPSLSGAVISAMVVDQSGKVLYTRSPDTRVMPASNQKLLTCSFALDRLGMEFRPKTNFFYDGDRLVIESSGDPSMTREKLLKAKAELAIGSVPRVQLKQAYRCSWPETWQIGDAPNRYAPAIHAFCFDKSGAELKHADGMLTAAGAGSTIKFVEEPGTTFRFQYDPFRGEVRYSGPVPSGSRTLDTISLPNPSAAAAELFGTLDPSPAEEVLGSPRVQIVGDPVKTLVKDCLRPSDNHLAEHLLMMGSKQSTHAKACSEMTRWLIGGPGLDRTAFKVADGSGLSRKNITTARSIVRLLMWQMKRPNYPVYRDALARSGGEGTLSNRLKSIHFVGKTGTLDMVTALSGYVQCSDGSTKIVSVMVNHYGCTAGEAREQIDKFVENVSK